MSTMVSNTSDQRESMPKVKQVSEVPKEWMDKVDRVFEFVETMRGKLESDSSIALTIKQASAYLGVSKTTLTQTLKDKIKPRKRGGIVRYLRHELDAYWIEAEETGELKTNQIIKSTKNNK